MQSKRRSFLKKLGMALASIPFSFTGIVSLFANGEKRSLGTTVWQDALEYSNDRTWIGEEYWSIPMEDWRVRKGRIEFDGERKFSRVNLLAVQLSGMKGGFSVSSNMGTSGGGLKKKGSGGFCIGIQDKLDRDHKAACYFGEGVNTGVSLERGLFLEERSKALPAGFDYADFTLSVNGNNLSDSAEIRVCCRDRTGLAAELVYDIAHPISGMLALVNNSEEAGGEPFWFQDIKVSGVTVEPTPHRIFGPVLWSMYTLSKNTLRLSAQMPPLSVKDNQSIDLFLKRAGSWVKASTARINSVSYTAQFELRGWGSNEDVPYQLTYKNNGKEHQYEGTIRSEPLNGQLKFASLTCQFASAFPYTPLVKNLKKHNPDILYFSGDQLYEGNGGYPIKREPEEKAILSYLGKWYMFGWAFGDLMHDRPTICTPDDHDVFHGNLWGEAGKPISIEEWQTIRDAHGGYVQTPAMVNVVGRTQCGHMPEAFHAEPLLSGIEPWYTDICYGGVSFAVISDRMFKSGPELVRERKADERIDHIKVSLPPGALEDPALEFLGKRQMAFLNAWVDDWKGAAMKVLLSQTLFANVGTHHGNDKMFLYGDMDSGGWPKQKRDEALRLIRKAAAFHINGDQHLPFIVQYGLDKPRDAGWTFCAPAISTGYIRWGEPDSMNTPYSDRPAHGLPNTGCYKDGFGNVNYIYAVGNPKDDFKDKDRYQQAQNKSSGFGIIDFDIIERTITMDAFRFLADKDRPMENDRFPGWPLTISQTDNDGRKPMGFLPLFEINNVNQMIRVINEENRELVSIIRIKGDKIQPGIHAEGSYTVIVGEGATAKIFPGLKPTRGKSLAIVKVAT